MNFSNYQNLRDLFTAIGNKLTHRPETIEISQADYDQLTTEQKNDKTKEYFIYDADGGGGSVQWTQVLSTGTKIAEVNINGTTQGVFAPSGSGSEVTWNQVQQSGTKIAEVSVNGVAQNVYAPAGGSGGGVSDVQVDGTSVVTDGVANITMPDVEDLASVNITSLIDGQILKYNATTEKWENTNEGGGASGMTILSYGNSTWEDFIAAYSTNTIVYCRASSNSDPASGSQTRMAFMAYVNNAQNPTEVEFQYYRSVSSKSDSAQGDQVFIYKITNAGTWTVLTRNTYTRIKAGTNMTSSYSSGVLTLNSTASGGTTVVANPSGTASTNLTKLQVDSTIYSVDGITVVANPSGTASESLSKLQVGNSIYEIPTANLGDVEKLYLVQSLPGDASSHPNTLYLIEEV